MSEEDASEAPPSDEYPAATMILTMTEDESTPSNDILNPPPHFEAWLESRKDEPAYKTWPSEWRGPDPTSNEEEAMKQRQYPTMHKDILNVFQQNKEWTAAKTEAHPDFFAVGGKRHKPKYMW
jgi:hypothetical protein